MDIGVTYIAEGDDYLDMAIMSANSIRRFMPKCGLALFTNKANLEISNPFNYILPIKREDVNVGTEKHKYYRSFLIARYNSLIDSPFEATLALYPDTYCVGSIAGVFTLLEKFDIILPYAHNRVKRSNEIGDIKQLNSVPIDFGLLQCGTIFCKRDSTQDVWKEVIKLYKDSPHFCDASVLRKILWERDISFYMLPPEYNFNRIRFIRSAKATGYMQCLPRILHYTDKLTRRNHKSLQRRLVKYVDQIEYRLNAIENNQVFNNSGLLTFRIRRHLIFRIRRFVYRILGINQ